MTVTSQNGWPVLDDTNTHLYQWEIPTDSGTVQLWLRRGPAGFVLGHWTMWFAEKIEPVRGLGDDFGWSYRRIPNSDYWSNHASGTAVDLNASTHPSGQAGTFTEEQTYMIRLRLDSTYDAKLRWGGDYQHAATDEMHYEVNSTQAEIRTLAQGLLGTHRGKRLLEANPSQVKYLSA